jgi:hypothetical protein
MKTIPELIKEKAALVIASYPTQGVRLDDLIVITIELCEDYERHPTPRTVKSVIKRSGFYKKGGRFYPDNNSVLLLPVATPPISGAVSKREQIPVQSVLTRNRVDWRKRVYGGYRGA